MKKTLLKLKQFYKFQLRWTFAMVGLGLPILAGLFHPSVDSGTFAYFPGVFFLLGAQGWHDPVSGAMVYPPLWESTFSVVLAFTINSALYYFVGVLVEKILMPKKKP